MIIAVVFSGVIFVLGLLIENVIFLIQMRNPGFGQCLLRIA